MVSSGKIIFTMHKGADCGKYDVVKKDNVANARDIVEQVSKLLRETDETAKMIPDILVMRNDSMRRTTSASRRLYSRYIGIYPSCVVTKNYEGIDLEQENEDRKTSFRCTVEYALLIFKWHNWFSK